jgi:hypothetical protein
MADCTPLIPLGLVLRRRRDHLLTPSLLLIVGNRLLPPKLKGGVVFLIEHVM